MAKHLSFIKSTANMENKMNEFNNSWERWQHLFT